LLDGHNRYEICTRLGIEFEQADIELDGWEDAEIWVIQHQLGRRNLEPFSTVELNLKLKSMIAKKAKANQGMRTDIRQNSAECRPINTRDEIAKASGVSHDTVSKVETIVNEATEEVKDQLRRGEKSIHAAYQEIKGDKKPRKVQASDGSIADPLRSNGTSKPNGTIVQDHVPDLTDEEWLETLTIREFISPYGKEDFDRGALSYRRSRDSFTESFKWKAKDVFDEGLEKVLRGIASTENGQRQSLYQVKLMAFANNLKECREFLGLPHPRDWNRCGSCNGLGCTACHRRGYVVS
jgi:hypothetical protein